MTSIFRTRAAGLIACLSLAGCFTFSVPLDIELEAVVIFDADLSEGCTGTNSSADGTSTWTLTPTGSGGCLIEVSYANPDFIPVAEVRGELEDAGQDPAGIEITALEARLISVELADDVGAAVSAPVIESWTTTLTIDDTDVLDLAGDAAGSLLAAALTLPSDDIIDEINAAIHGTADYVGAGGSMSLELSASEFARWQGLTSTVHLGLQISLHVTEGSTDL